MENKNLETLGDILFNIPFGLSIVDDQILASLLVEQLEEQAIDLKEDDIVGLEEFLPLIFEFLSNKGLVETELDDELDRIMKILNQSRFKVELELMQMFHKGAEVMALLDIDNDWHPGVLESYDLITQKALIRFSEWPSITAELTKEKYHLSSSREEIKKSCCYFCKREMKLSRHHLYPQMHYKYIKKGFTKEFLNSNTLSICRPCHSAVHRAEPNEKLASDYNTAESLMKHPKIINFVNYIKNRI